MTNYIYLMKDEKKDFALFKVGFTSDMERRFTHYTTHNPLIECISYIRTYEKSKRFVETMIHQEIRSKGYKFITARIDGKTTEFFKVSYDDSFYKELNEKGLNAFKFARNRKNLGCYVLSKD